MKYTQFTYKGQRVLTQEYIQELRDKDAKKANNLAIIAQKGAQERMLAQNADIVICGGSRGGSKSFSLLMETLKDIKNKNFAAVILRKEKDDLEGLINDSEKLYTQFGKYKRAKNDQRWVFNTGGWLTFLHYSGAFADFKDRFQGRQYSFIGIDEITQIEYKKFKYLLTNNRNASHLKNRFWGTCNPDPDSWVRKFIDWWIGEDGLAMPERDGVVRYCFMEGDSPDSIYWGDTPEDVYLQCKHLIDPLWKESYDELGYNKITMFIKSVVFVRADLSENVKLVRSDPSYFASLAQQDEEQKMRDLQGNWNYKAMGDDMIKLEDMEAFFDNAHQRGDNLLRASADVALEGGDNFVMWLWEGRHIKDLFICRMDSRTLISVIEEKLGEWGVQQSNFTYDMQGLGQFLKGFFPDAVPFNNQASPIARSFKEEKGIKFLYKDLKSQCAWLFYDAIRNREISIDKRLLDLKFSGNGFENVPLKQILLKERKSIRGDSDYSDRGFKILPKKKAKKIVGHSPDTVEALYYIFVFFIKSNTNKKKNKGLWLI